MRHRRALLCALTLASRHAGFADALFLRRVQVRSPNMHHQVFNISRRRMLSLSTRAAFACSGTVHLSQQQHQQQQGLGSRPLRWTSSSSNGGSNFGAGCWRLPKQPAMAMSAAAPRGSIAGTRSVASGPLRFRGGATTEGGSSSFARSQCLLLVLYMQ